MKNKTMTGEKLYVFLFCVFTSFIPFLAVDMPHSLSFTPSLVGAICYGTYFFVFKEKPEFSRPALWLILIILCLSSLSLLWAAHPDTSLDKVLQLTYLLPPLVLVMSLAKTLKKEKLEPYIRLFPYGVAIASIFLCFEILTGGLVYNLIRGKPVNIPTDPDDFNQPAIVLALYSFVTLAILQYYSRKFWHLAIFLAPLLVALAVAQSQSAQLSFSIGIFFLFFFPYQSKMAWYTLRAIILVTLLSAPFLVGFIYENYAGYIEGMPMMSKAYAGHRLEIWSYVSEYALQRPLQGFGIEATRAITDFESREIFKRGNTVLHPHNFVFQIWIEFGLAGILIAMLLMNKLLSSIQNSFSIEKQKIILPTFVAALVPCSFAFGLWQSWWLVFLFHLAAMCVIACKFTDSKSSLEERL